MIRLAILAMLISSPAIALEIGGSAVPVIVDPARDQREANANEARMLRGLADCKAGRESGSVCHGYCRGDDYRFDRARYCDQWGNFRSTVR